MKRIYHLTTPLIYKNIQQDSPVRLVFLSGMGSPIRLQREAFFRRFALTHGISYTALDYTKHALQYRSQEFFRIPTFLSMTQSILEETPEKKLLLFGACFGGLVGMKMAQEIPSKIAGLVVTSPPYEFSEFPWVQKADDFLHNKVQEKAKEKNVKFTHLKRLAVLHKLFVATTRTVSKTPLLNTYQGPITLFHGQRDPLIPVDNSFLIQKVSSNPNMQLCIIPHMKHTLAFDKEMKQPLAILKQYLDNIKSPSK